MNTNMRMHFGEDGDGYTLCGLYIRDTHAATTNAIHRVTCSECNDRITAFEAECDGGTPAWAGEDHTINR